MKTSSGDHTERLLFVSRLLHEGEEADLREAIERNFPAEAFEEAGLVGFTAHVGGGYCVLEFGYEGSFDDIFGALASDPVVTKYMDLLGRHVSPAPHVDPDHTAGLPLAADQFLWRAETGTASRTPGRSTAKRGGATKGRGGARPATAGTAGRAVAAKPGSTRSATVRNPKVAAARTSGKSGNGGRATGDAGRATAARGTGDAGRATSARGTGDAGRATSARGTGGGASRVAATSMTGGTRSNKKVSPARRSR